MDSCSPLCYADPVWNWGRRDRAKLLHTYCCKCSERFSNAYHLTLWELARIHLTFIFRGTKKWSSSSGTTELFGPQQRTEWPLIFCTTVRVTEIFRHWTTHIAWILDNKNSWISIRFSWNEQHCSAFWDRKNLMIISNTNVHVKYLTLGGAVCIKRLKYSF